jgi:hypothetical protein
MTLPGQRSRALIGACAYVAGITVLLGVAVTAALAYSTENVPKVAALAKIGPGYARMQPINEGKPEKVLYTTPYTIPARAHVVASAKRAPSSIEAPIAQSAPSVRVAAVEAPRSTPDFHRIY